MTLESQNNSHNLTENQSQDSVGTTKLTLLDKIAAIIKQPRKNKEMKESITRLGNQHIDIVYSYIVMMNNHNQLFSNVFNQIPTDINDLDFVKFLNEDVSGFLGNKTNEQQISDWNMMKFRYEGDKQFRTYVDYMFFAVLPKVEYFFDKTGSLIINEDDKLIYANGYFVKANELIKNNDGYIVSVVSKHGKRDVYSMNNSNTIRYKKEDVYFEDITGDKLKGFTGKILQVDKNIVFIQPDGNVWQHYSQTELDTQNIVFNDQGFVVTKPGGDWRDADIAKTEYTYRVMQNGAICDTLEAYRKHYTNGLIYAEEDSVSKMMYEFEGGIKELYTREKGGKYPAGAGITPGGYVVVRRDTDNRRLDCGSNSNITTFYALDGGIKTEIQGELLNDYCGEYFQSTQTAFGRRVGYPILYTENPLSTFTYVSEGGEVLFTITSDLIYAGSGRDGARCYVTTLDSSKTKIVSHSVDVEGSVKKTEEKFEKFGDYYVIYGEMEKNGMQRVQFYGKRLNSLGDVNGKDITLENGHQGDINITYTDHRGEKRKRRQSSDGGSREDFVN